jgi:hypothetical protein
MSNLGRFGENERLGGESLATAKGLREGIILDQPHQCGIIWRLPNQDVAHVAIQTFISWKIVKHF